MGKVYTYIQPMEQRGIDKDYFDTELEKKLDKDGHVLTDNNYTTLEKNKLNGIAEGANNYSHPSKHLASIITQDANHKFVSDEEKVSWNSKASGEHTHQDLIDLINSLANRVSELENPVQSEI